MLQLTDLREILRYVPRFRDQLFVIALDGVIVEEENFKNLLLDIALLRSLRIQVALVHGAGHQIRQLAERTGTTVSNFDGTGVTDEETLRVALWASSKVSHEIMEGLAACDLRAAVGNVIVAHPAGILRGIDQGHTGRVERIDAGLLRAFLDRDIVPVIAPLGCDGEGNSYRLSSDAVAVDVALAMGAVKLIFLTNLPGIEREGTLLRQLSTEEAESVLTRSGERLSDTARQKLREAIRATKAGTPRAHIIDGRMQEGLLAEVFSNEGVGTLIHANEYRAIRPATLKDVSELQALIQGGIESDELMQRSRQELEEQIEDFYVFEVDRNVVGCAALHHYADEGKGEIACVCVDARFANQGIGLKLVKFIESRAQALDLEELLCLSTQAYNFFVHKAGFHQATPDILPESRRHKYEESGRRSRVLSKTIGNTGSG